MISSIYRQPNSLTQPSKPFQLSQALSKLESALHELSSSPTLVICGDFNVPEIDWTNGQPHDSHSQMITTIEHIQSRLFLTQMITKPTHKLGNTLDLIFSNNKQLFNEITYSPTLKSDHYSIQVATHFKSHFAQHFKYKQKNYSTLFDATNYFSEDVEWDSIKLFLRSQNFLSEFDQQETAAAKLDYLIKSCEVIGANNAPKKNSFNSKKQKIPRVRKTLMRRRRKVTTHLAKNLSPVQKSKLINELIEIERKLQDSFTSSEHHQEAKAIEAIKHNPKYFFSYVKKFSKMKTVIGPLKNTNSEYVSDSKDMANVLAKQYTSVFSTPKDSLIDPYSLFTNESIPEILTDFLSC